MSIGDIIEKKILIQAFIIFSILFSSAVAASNLVNLEVLVLSPGMEETISVNLNEEFSLNGKIQQKALITDYDDLVYDNIVIELSKITEINGEPEAELKISALKNRVPVTLDVSYTKARNEENVFGVKVKLLNFLKEREEYVGASFTVEKEDKFLIFLISTFVILLVILYAFKFFKMGKHVKRKKVNGRKKHRKKTK